MSAQPYQPSALSDVMVSVDGDDTVVSFPRVLPYSVEKVWEAITDPEMLAQWTPYTADRNLSRTGDAVITMLTEDGAPEMSLPVTVHVVETSRRLEHEWGPDELASPPDRSWVTRRASTAGTHSTPVTRDSWASTNLRSGSCSEFATGRLSGGGTRD
eukprot:gene27010-32529_t